MKCMCCLGLIFLVCLSDICGLCIFKFDSLSISVNFFYILLIPIATGIYNCDPTAIRNNLWQTIASVVELLIDVVSFGLWKNIVSPIEK